MKSTFALALLAVAAQAGGDGCDQEFKFISDKMDCMDGLFTECYKFGERGALDRTEDLMSKCGLGAYTEPGNQCWEEIEFLRNEFDCPGDDFKDCMRNEGGEVKDRTDKLMEKCMGQGWSQDGDRDGDRDGGQDDERNWNECAEEIRFVFENFDCEDATQCRRKECTATTTTTTTTTTTATTECPRENREEDLMSKCGFVPSTWECVEELEYVAAEFNCLGEDYSQCFRTSDGTTAMAEDRTSDIIKKCWNDDSDNSDDEGDSDNSDDDDHLRGCEVTCQANGGLDFNDCTTTVGCHWDEDQCWSAVGNRSCDHEDVRAEFWEQQCDDFYSMVAKDLECDFGADNIENYDLCFRKDDWSYAGDIQMQYEDSCTPCESEIKFVAANFDCFFGDYTKCTRKEVGGPMVDRSGDFDWKCGYQPALEDMPVTLATAAATQEASSSNAGMYAGISFGVIGLVAAGAMFAAKSRKQQVAQEQLAEPLLV